MLAALEEERATIHDALRRPLCDFGIDHTAGLFGQNPHLEVAQLCGRMLVFEILVALDDEDPAAATDSFWAALKLSACLAAESHVPTRMHAAFLRALASDALHYLVHHPLVSAGQLAALHDVVIAHLTTWTPDRVAWVGDRSAGLLAYEMARGGEVLGLLTPAEIEESGARDALKQLVGDRRLEVVDRDQAFYLDWSARIIAACEQPYFERRVLLESLRLELHNRRQSPDYPFIAARVLLSDVHRGHETQARDRELFEAWDLALAYALDRTAPAYKTSPLSGREYLIDDNDGTTEVTLFSPIRDNRTWSVVVPWPARTPQDAAFIGSARQPR